MSSIFSSIEISTINRERLFNLSKILDVIIAKNELNNALKSSLKVLYNKNFLKYNYFKNGVDNYYSYLFYSLVRKEINYILYPELNIISNLESNDINILTNQYDELLNLLHKVNKTSINGIIPLLDDSDKLKLKKIYTNFFPNIQSCQDYHDLVYHVLLQNEMIEIFDKIVLLRSNSNNSDLVETVFSN